ncbi:hypothetical protein RRG08_016896 [Elysia crispata]|uniref:Uncharacterized protein n=1 Tax=Elysia crispata TaxID=231223 RepID=A0AAE1DEW4_9GAST|nr:hypothetical protein RRG08_016896 [Elysia crispata]
MNLTKEEEITFNVIMSASDIAFTAKIRVITHRAQQLHAAQIHMLPLCSVFGHANQKAILHNFQEWALLKVHCSSALLIIMRQCGQENTRQKLRPLSNRMMKSKKGELQKF